MHFLVAIVCVKQIVLVAPRGGDAANKSPLKVAEGGLGATGLCSRN